MNDEAVLAWMEKAKKAAIRREWENADGFLHQALESATEDSQAIAKALEELAADCDKLSINEVMQWAYQWVVQIDPTKATPYLRLATYHERVGQLKTATEWLRRGIDMAEPGSQTAVQLRRAYRRIQRSRSF